MEIGVRELKDRLSEIIQLAHDGALVTITNHGQAVCMLSPLETNAVALPAVIKEAIERGEIIPAKQRVLKLHDPITPRNSGPTTTQILLESRRERIN